MLKIGLNAQPITTGSPFPLYCSKRGNNFIIWCPTINKKYLSNMKYKSCNNSHDDVIIWKHFPSYWTFVREFNCSRWIPQWRAALVVSLICVWMNGWVNNREAGDLRRYRVHYDVTVMATYAPTQVINSVSSLHSVTLVTQFQGTQGVPWQMSYRKVWSFKCMKLVVTAPAHVLILWRFSVFWTHSTL